MGQENSCESEPVLLSSRSLEAIAEYIKNGAKNICVMTGAGVSTSAGIPDFRSPETGIYANLAKFNLPEPEDMFSISFFRENPQPFYVLAKELYPGNFFPTVSHAFIALLHEKGLLKMLFTQNIDCLDRLAGVPDSKIVEAHGSFATQRCIDCKTEYPDDLMMKAVADATVPYCNVPQCNGLVKPDIVFFGEQLPKSFFDNADEAKKADLVIVMGSSLSVGPFNALPSLCAGVPRLLFNMDRVGDFGSRPDDVIELGDCDSGVRKLADALGWADELEELWLEVGGKVGKKEAARLRAARLALATDELLEDEIEKITGTVDDALKLDQPEAITNGSLSIDKVKENAALADARSDMPLSEVFELIGKAYQNTPYIAQHASLPVRSQSLVDVTLPQNKPNHFTTLTNSDKEA